MRELCYNASFPAHSTLVTLNLNACIFEFHFADVDNADVNIESRCGNGTLAMFGDVDHLTRIGLRAPFSFPKRVIKYFAMKFQISFSDIIVIDKILFICVFLK